MFNATLKPKFLTIARVYKKAGVAKSQTEFTASYIGYQYCPCRPCNQPYLLRIK